MSNRIDERAAEVERVATEFDDELYQLAIVRRRPIAAIARATGINEETMKKRVARIRRTRAAVQHHEAA